LTSEFSVVAEQELQWITQRGTGNV